MAGSRIDVIDRDQKSCARSPSRHAVAPARFEAGHVAWRGLSLQTVPAMTAFITMRLSPRRKSDTTSVL